MACLNFLGFETGDALEMGQASGSLSIQTSVVYSGVYALQVNSTTTSTPYAQIVGLGATGVFADMAAATAYTTFYFQTSAYPSGGPEPLITVQNGFGQDKLQIRISDTGLLTVHEGGNSNAQVGSAGATTIALNTWYRLGVRAGNGAAATFELQINGATELSGTANQRADAVARVLFGRTQNVSSSVVDFYYDDIWIDDAGYKDVKVLRLAPDGDGNSTQWTGTWQDVDEVPHDSNTTSIDTSTSTQVETVTVESATSAGVSSTIPGVKSVAICREPTSVSSSFQLRLRSNTTNNDTTSANLSTTFTLLGKLYELDPATTAAWTLSAVDAVQVGVEANGNVNHRCTALCAMVAYTPVASGHPAVKRMGGVGFASHGGYQPGFGTMRW